MYVCINVVRTSVTHSAAPRVPLFLLSVIYYWTDARQLGIYLLNSKRVTRAVKIVDSCSRENGFLCTVARSWLLFLHDESEWKNFESNIAWGVDELHQTFWFEQFFNGKLCCKIHDLLSVSIVFFWIGLLGAISRWMFALVFNKVIIQLVIK